MCLCPKFDDDNRHLFNKDYNYIVGLPSISPRPMNNTVQWCLSCNIAQRGRCVYFCREATPVPLAS